MKRAGQPTISRDGMEALNRYEAYLQHMEDMSPVTIRNYLSDLRQFIAWCEAGWQEGQEGEHPFAPTSVVTPTLTRYRSYLQTVLQLKPASVNRALVSLKRYFAWATEGRLIQHDPSKAVKLVPAVEQAPHQLSDREEEDSLLQLRRTEACVTARSLSSCCTQVCAPEKCANYDRLISPLGSGAASCVW